jgi:protein ImuB
MRLWIGLHLPRLPLEVFCPNWSADTCAAVLDHEAVLAASDDARRAGVLPGMRRGGALMMAPDVLLHDRAPEREEEALHAVAMALLQYTPQVAQGEEATLLMDVGASLRLFGGIRRLCALVRESLRKLGFTAVLAVAPTARGAWLLARGGGGRSLTIGKMVRRLQGLPASLLPPARPYRAWLEGIGCLSVGDVARLPRAGLQRRCGRELLDMLDAAHGHGTEMFRWIEAPATFHAKLELFGRIDNTDLLLAGARRLLEQLTGWLNVRHLAVQRITLLLEHERGRVARPPTPVEIVLADAVWHDDHLVRLLKERLAKLVLEAPVIGLVLDAPQVRPMAPQSESLFPEPGGSSEDRQRLFELLAARLGADNVLQAAPKADYRPEHANAWVTVQEASGTAAGGVQLPPGSLPRPTWLLPKPIALIVRDHRPFYCSPLRLVSMAELIEAGWWGETQTRDYFIAQGEDNAYYWIYRERLPGGDDADLRWYLHGLFG